MNGVEVDGMLADWDPLPIEAPQPPKGLGLEDGKAPLPTEGNDGGM